MRSIDICWYHRFVWFINIIIVIVFDSLHIISSSRSSSSSSKYILFRHRRIWAKTCTNTFAHATGPCQKKRMKRENECCCWNKNGFSQSQVTLDNIPMHRIDLPLMLECSVTVVVVLLRNRFARFLAAVSAQQSPIVPIEFDDRLCSTHTRCHGHCFCHSHRCR